MKPKNKATKKTVKNKKKIVAVSGGFDPLHIGHVRMFKEAKKLGDKLVVILNNDNWIKKKKGHGFMNEKDRKEIIEALECVDEVFITKHPENPEDMSVCHALEELRPHIFAQGGDRDKKDGINPNSSQAPEVVLCTEYGVEIVYNVGHGGKIRSSSELLKAYSKKKNKRV